MDFQELLKLLKENAGAVTFVKSLQSEQSESKDKMIKLADEADRNKSAATDVEKYKTEAKDAFEQRDKLKEQIQQLKDGSGEPDKQLLEKIESLELANSSLSGQILDSEKNTILNNVLAGMDFRGEGEAKDRLIGIVRSELSKGLIKHDEFGFVYADDKGHPIRNPDDVSKFLTPKDNINTKGMKEFLNVISGVDSSGDNFQGDQNNNGGGGDKPRTSSDRLKAAQG